MGIADAGGRQDEAPFSERLESLIEKRHAEIVAWGEIVHARNPRDGREPNDLVEEAYLLALESFGLARERILKIGIESRSPARAAVKSSRRPRALDRAAKEAPRKPLDT